MEYTPIPIPDALDPEDEGTVLKVLRQNLKQYLFYERGKRAPLCPICGNSVTAPSMHEVLMPRNLVQRNSFNVKVQIHVSQNCVLLHEPDCHRFAQHDPEGKEMCVKQLIEFEGYRNIVDWLNHMNSITTVVAKEPTRYFMNFIKENYG